MVDIFTLILLLVLFSLGQVVMLYWFKARLHHITFRVLGLSHLVFSLLLIIQFVMIKIGIYESIPSILRLIILFSLIILPGSLFLTQIGSILYSVSNRKFPYIFLQYADHGPHYITQLRKNRNDQLKQIDLQWRDNVTITIPVLERIIVIKHGKHYFESYKIDSNNSLLIRLDSNNSNHYVFFSKGAYLLLDEMCENELLAAPVTSDIQNNPESELLFHTDDKEYVLIIDTFVLFDFPILLSLLEKNNKLVLSPKVFDSFPYHKIRQPQFRGALSIINQVLQKSERIHFGEDYLENNATNSVINEIDRLISIALTEQTKGTTVFMLTSNSKLKLKCRHYNIPYVDAHSLMKTHNTAFNPIYHLTFIPTRTS